MKDYDDDIERRITVHLKGDDGTKTYVAHYRIQGEELDIGPIYLGELDVSDLMVKEDINKIAHMIMVVHFGDNARADFIRKAPIH